MESKGQGVKRKDRNQEDTHQIQA
jgi:ribosome assembly protein RRB1